MMSCLSILYISVFVATGEEKRDVFQRRNTGIPRGTPDETSNRIVILVHMAISWMLPLKKHLDASAKIQIFHKSPFLIATRAASINLNDIPVREVNIIVTIKTTPAKVTAVSNNYLLHQHTGTPLLFSVWSVRLLPLRMGYCVPILYHDPRG